MRLRFSVNTWIFGKCTFEEVLDRVAALRYDGVELAGEPETYPAQKVTPMLGDRGLAAASICGIFPGPEAGFVRYLGHNDPAERQVAIDYIKSCVETALGVGAPCVVVAPVEVGHPAYFSVSREEDWKRAVESLQTAAEYAEASKVYLTIEPLNRYEAGLVNSVRDALRMAQEVGNPYVRIMADTFHMQIEEPDGIPNAIRRAGGEWLKHFHAADNTREAPGLGTMPWREILRALHQIDFEGWVSLEPLPRGASPYDVMNSVLPREAMDTALASGLKFLRMLDEMVAGGQ